MKSSSVIIVISIFLEHILCKNITSVTDPLQRVMARFNLYQVNKTALRMHLAILA